MTHALGRERTCIAADRAVLAGMYCVFSCAYNDVYPADCIDIDANGWVQRRQIKAYAEREGLKDYRIIRNTAWQQDLHGTVYQLWAWP